MAKRWTMEHLGQDVGNFIYETADVDGALLAIFKKKKINPVEMAFRESEQGYEDRQRHHQKWQVCACFLGGEQWIDWSPATGGVRRLADTIDWKRPGVIYAVMDRIRPAYMYKLGQIIDTVHVPQVIPQDELQYGDAQLQTAYAQALYTRRDFDELNEQVVAGFLAFGLHWIKPYWDEKSGLAAARTLSAFEGMPLPYGINGTREMKRFVETRAIETEELKAEFPDAMKDWSAKELEEEHNLVLGSLDSFLTAQGASRSIRGMSPVRELYQAPCRDFPKGYRMKFLAKRLLSLVPLDEAETDLPLPFYDMTYTVFPGAVYPPGLVEGEVSKQMLRNKLFSDIMANINAQGVGAKLLNPQSLSINENDLTDATRRVVSYADDQQKPENRPTYLQRPSIEGDIQWVKNWIDTDMDDDMARHEPSRGMAMGSIQSGVGIQNLQNRDDQPLSPVLKRMRRQYRRMWTHLMTLTNAHYEEGKPLYGVNMLTGAPYAAKEFKRCRTGGPIRVEIQMVSNTPRDIAESRQRLMELAQYGGLDDLSPADKRAIIHYGTDPSMYSPGNMDRLVARMENNLFVTKDPALRAKVDVTDLSVKPWHDHILHIEEHRNLCNHPDFNDEPEIVQRDVLAHYQMHQEYDRLGRVAMQEPAPGGAGNQAAGGGGGQGMGPVAPEAAAAGAAMPVETPAEGVPV